MRTSGFSVIASALIGAALLVGPEAMGAAGRTPSSPAQQAPTFRAAVDLIAVDVQVARASGEPVQGLIASDFEVRIDGRARRVVSAEFVQAAAPRPRAALPGTSPAARNDWPTTAGPDRTFILALDSSSLRGGDSLPVVRAAAAFIEKVPANDLIGVVVLPNGAQLAPTVDRTLVRQALSRVVGTRRSLATSFRLNLVEVIEISSQAGSIRTQAMARGRGAEPSPAGETLRSVQRRECEGDPQCVHSLLADAEQLAEQMEMDAARSLGGLSTLLRVLREHNGRKTVIVVSGGIPSSDRLGGRPDVGDSASVLGEHAARANAVVYAVHVDRTLRDRMAAQAGAVAQELSTARERAMQSKLLADFAYPSGGALLTSIADDGEVALDRVLLETSGYYLLGVEPQGNDRDGRVHRLQVRVANDHTVRSRRWVVVSPSKGSR
jgi:VWFA-related protein